MTKNYEKPLQIAIDLVTDMKEYIEASKKRPRQENDIYISEELSNMTVNITTLVSWLFMLKALDHNEISSDKIIEEGNLLIKNIKDLPYKLESDEYPKDFLSLKEKVIILQDEVKILYQNFIQQTLN